MEQSIKDIESFLQIFYNPVPHVGSFYSYPAIHFLPLPTFQCARPKEAEVQIFLMTNTASHIAI